MKFSSVITLLFAAVTIATSVPIGKLSHKSTNPEL
jgi:hypothetical protein